MSVVQIETSEVGRGQRVLDGSLLLTGASATVGDGDASQANSFVASDGITRVVSVCSHLQGTHGVSKKDWTAYLVGLRASAMLLTKWGILTGQLKDRGLGKLISPLQEPTGNSGGDPKGLWVDLQDHEVAMLHSWTVEQAAEILHLHYIGKVTAVRTRTLKGTNIYSGRFDSYELALSPAAGMSTLSATTCVPAWCVKVLPRNAKKTPTMILRTHTLRFWSDGATVDEDYKDGDELPEGQFELLHHSLVLNRFAFQDPAVTSGQRKLLKSGLVELTVQLEEKLMAPPPPPESQGDEEKKTKTSLDKHREDKLIANLLS